MWKLIPVAAITIPWIALPYAPMAESINDTLKQPVANKESNELASLSMCQETDIDLYFHNELMKFHTAEYLSDIFEAADDCGHVSVQIFPIKLNDSDEKQSVFQAENIVETMLYLDAYNINHALASPDSDEWDSRVNIIPSGEGHTLTIRVVPRAAEIG